MQRQNGIRARSAHKRYISVMRNPVHMALLLPLLGATLFAQSGLPSTRNDDAAAAGHVQRDSTRNTWHATLTGNGAGLWFSAWQVRTSGGAAIEGAFLSGGQRSGLQTVRISDPQQGVEDARPATVFLDDSTVFVVWQRDSVGRNAIIGRVLRRDGTLGTVFPVSDGSAPGMMPAAGRGSAGDIVVAWQDYRNGDVDIYAQRFDSRVAALGENVRINDDASHALQGAPHIAADNGKRILLMWPDNRTDGAWKFYCQAFGTAAENVLIDSAQRKAMTTLISGVWLNEDSALFTWKDYREDHSNIYYRRADLRDASFAPAVRINDDTGDRWQRLAVTDGDGRGHTVVCWEDYRNTEINQRGDIYLQVFARDGSPSGRNIKVNDRDDRIARKMPAISMDGAGGYLVIWHQGEEGFYNIMGQWFRYPDHRDGANFCLTCGEE